MDPVPLFVMPGTALRYLLEEFMLTLGEQGASGGLYRYGERCGEGVSEIMGRGLIEGEVLDEAGEVTPEVLEQLAKRLPELWMQIGLSTMQEIRIADRSLIIEIPDSVEAQMKMEGYAGGCSFSAGYLAGLVTDMVGNRFRTIEEACRGRGDPSCRFVLRQDRVRPLSYRALEERKYPVERGTVYLYETEEPGEAYELFNDGVRAGEHGLCISRTFPKKAEEQYGIDTDRTAMLWLSRDNTPGAINPHDLGKLNHIIAEFLERSKPGVVILDGLEYLVTQTSFESVLKFLQLVNERTALFGAVFIIPISRGAFSEKDLSLLKRELVLYDADAHQVNEIAKIFGRMR